MKTTRRNATRKILNNTTNAETKMQQQENLAGALSQINKMRTSNKGGEDEQRELRRRVSKLAMTANKRIQRLEKSGFEFARAYREAFQHNSQKFGVRGLQGNKEVLRELERIDKFLASQTSTLTGVKKYLDKIADKKGIKLKKGEYQQFAVQQSNMFRAHEKLAQFRPVERQYSSDDEMEALNSIIEELDDGYSYSADEIEAVVELAIEEEAQVVLTRDRRHQGTTKAKPVVLSTNKAVPIDLEW